MKESGSGGGSAGVDHMGTDGSGGGSAGLHNTNPDTTKAASDSLHNIEQLRPDIEEVCRYMGVRRGMADARILQLAEAAVDELLPRLTPREVHRDFPLSVRGEVCDFTCFSAKSRTLARHLAGCERVLLFAATIGEGADLLIRRYAKRDVARAAAVQAASAAMIETYADALCAMWQEAFALQGYQLITRYSPGYGDFPLDVQPLFADVLKMEKHTGITLTDSLLMMPSKSITAVIGMRKGACREAAPALDRCAMCGKTDCAFSEKHDKGSDPLS